jgi:hypothetical protein
MKWLNNLDADVRRSGRVGQHDVEGVGGQMGEQLLGVLFPAHEPDWRRRVHQRPQQAACDELGHGVRHADRQRQGAPGLAGLDRVEQFAADVEDLVCVQIDHPPDVGEHEGAAVPVEQLDVQHLLQPLDLGRDGWLRQAELLAGPRHAAFARRDPEYCRWW